MPIQALLGRYQALQDHATIELISSPQSAEIVAVLVTLLGGETKRRSQSDFNERLDKELRWLREHGITSLPAAAATCCNTWCDRQWLTREFPDDESEEQVELSAHALRAIQIMDSFELKRNAANESRLSILTDQLSQFAEDTDPDPSIRLGAIDRQIERLKAQREAINAGRSTILDERQSLDALQLIIEQVRRVTDDFARTREEIRLVQKQLNIQIQEDNAARGAVINEILSGINVIAESEVGRSTNALFTLINSVTESTRLQDAISNIFDREFILKVSIQDQALLQRLPRILVEEGKRNQQRMNDLGRELRTYILSREFRQQREMSALIKVTRKLAMELKELPKMPRQKFFTLKLTRAHLDQITRHHLKDEDPNIFSSDLVNAESDSVDLSHLAEMFRAGDIDWRMLRNMVNTALRSFGYASIGAIIANGGAPQGIASVLGLIKLAIDEGIVTEKEEIIHWRSPDGHRYTATIPEFFFLKELGTHGA